MIKLIILIIVAIINIFLASKYYVQWRSEIVIALNMAAVICYLIWIENKKEGE